MENTWILIPARKGSKGFPFKNRKLLDFTINSIPKEYLNIVYVSTDDDCIRNRALELNVNVIDRPSNLAADETSMKDVLQHFIKIKGIPKNSNIILLYLTYPERTWLDISDIYNFFKDKKVDSLICADEVDQHPYLCFYERENLKGEMVIKHNFYRRQDYPKCLKQSMFVACYKTKIVDKLNDLMVEDNSIFYKLEKNKVDVDYKIDFDKIQIGVNK